MDFFVFVSHEWLLVTTLIVLIYIYVWRDRIKSGRPVSPHEVTRLVNEGNAVLVDLRDSAEFKAGHIVGAINVPYAKLTKESTEVASYMGTVVEQIVETERLVESLRPAMDQLMVDLQGV